MRPDATLAAPAMMAGKDIAKVRFIVSLLLVSCLGMLFALCVVPVRAGGIWDSVAYAGTARNIAKGLGFFMAHRLPLVPLTNWPPLYPIILAGPAYFGIDPAVSARWINGLFMGCSTFFAGFIAWAYCGRSYAMGILAVLSILLSPDIIEIHSQILSEPPFIAFTLACIAGLLLYAESGRTKHLIAAALAISAALVTRYAGIFLLAGAALALVLNWRHLKQRKTPFIDLGLAFIIAFLPSCAWSVHNLLMNGRAVGGRKFVIHWLGLQRLRDLFRTVTLWFTTAVVSPSIRFVVLVVLLAVGLSSWVEQLG